MTLLTRWTRISLKFDTEYRQWVDEERFPENCISGKPYIARIIIIYGSTTFAMTYGTIFKCCIIVFFWFSAKACHARKMSRTTMRLNNKKKQLLCCSAVTPLTQERECSLTVCYIKTVSLHIRCGSFWTNFKPWEENKLTKLIENQRREQRGIVPSEIRVMNQGKEETELVFSLLFNKQKFHQPCPEGCRET